MARLIPFLTGSWRLVAFGFLLTFASGLGQTFFIGLFADDVRAVLGLSPGSYGTVYGLATILSAAAIIWAGRHIDAVDLRLYAGAALVGLATACMAFAGLGAVPTWLALPAAVGTLFLLRFTGQGLMGHIAQTTIGRYVHQDRGKAVAMAVQGHPVSEAVLPLPAVLLAGWLGWRGSWALFAAVVLLAVLPIALALLRGHAGRKAALAAHVRQAAAAAVRAGTGPDGPAYRRRDVLGEATFYLIIPAVLAQPFINTGVFFHQTSLVAEKGWELAYFAGLFPVYAGAVVLASLVAGPVIDRLSAAPLVALLPVPLVLGLLILATGEAAWLAPVYMALVGSSTGLQHTLMGALWPELYGTRHLGAIRALTHGLMVSATAAAPVIFGQLLDAGITMAGIAQGGTIACLIATALALAGQRRRRARRA